MRGRDSLEPPVFGDDVDHAVVGENGHGQAPDPLEGDRVVERGREHAAGLGEKGEAPPFGLRVRPRSPLAGEELLALGLGAFGRADVTEVSREQR